MHLAHLMLIRANTIASDLRLPTPHWSSIASSIVSPYRSSAILKHSSNDFVEGILAYIIAISIASGHTQKFVFQPKGSTNFSISTSAHQLAPCLQPPNNLTAIQHAYRRCVTWKHRSSEPHHTPARVTRRDLHPSSPLSGAVHPSTYPPSSTLSPPQIWTPEPWTLSGKEPQEDPFHRRASLSLPHPAGPPSLLSVCTYASCVTVHRQA